MLPRFAHVALSAAAALGLTGCVLVGYDRQLTVEEMSAVEAGPVQPSSPSDAGAPIFVPLEAGRAERPAAEASVVEVDAAAPVSADAGERDAAVDASSPDAGAPPEAIDPLWYLPRVFTEGCTGSRCPDVCTGTEDDCIADCRNAENCQGACRADQRCRVDCTGGEECDFACPARTECSLACDRAGDCSMLCGPESHCVVTCTRAESCDVACLPDSDCVVDCSQGDCGRVRCAAGARCLLQCSQPAGCDIDCDGVARSCPDGSVTCNRACL